jgi:hypothetical protein
MGEVRDGSSWDDVLGSSDMPSLFMINMGYERFIHDYRAKAGIQYPLSLSQ